jgi:hypothetical protein
MTPPTCQKHGPKVETSSGWRCRECGKGARPRCAREAEGGGPVNARRKKPVKPKAWQRSGGEPKKREEQRHRVTRSAASTPPTT